MIFYLNIYKYIDYIYSHILFSIYYYLSFLKIIIKKSLKFIEEKILLLIINGIQLKKPIFKLMK